MSRLLAACAALALALPVSADDKPKPNTLTAKEVADGWVLLFDGETTFGWKVGEQPAEKVTVKDGRLVLNGGDVPAVAVTSGPLPWYYELRADVELVGESSFKTIWKEHADSYAMKLTKGATGFRLVYAPEGDPDAKLRHTIEWTDGDGKVVASERMLGQACGPMKGPALGISVPKGSRASFGRVRIRPLATTPLFAGKNLDGWKVNQADPKRVASKFEVTKAGELSVKDGPGDLVTDKEFDNFVLQFECKTLGDGLNSGVFFRCIPGQYQNGYEAQVQNAFLDKDRTKPKDFGTGAIYRRVPARKVVSDDREWFTMTVVADGRHISTWVNGYQTVDWTDDRKENENPRQGYRAAKGPLSIQGHDPTTDLLFRNIRVAELPGK
jgi:hypothetical protein